MQRCFADLGPVSVDSKQCEAPGVLKGPKKLAKEAEVLGGSVPGTFFFFFLSVGMLPRRSVNTKEATPEPEREHELNSTRLSQRA